MTWLASDSGSSSVRVILYGWPTISLAESLYLSG